MYKPVCIPYNSIMYFISWLNIVTAVTSKEMLVDHKIMQRVPLA